jgi:hypothetical protein
MVVPHDFSRVLRRVLSFVVLWTVSCFGQERLHQWDFGQGVGTWFAANSCAPLTVADGNLQVRVTGFDPFVHSSRGADFGVDARAGVFIRMKARCNVSGPGEFFWAGTTAGTDAGFVAKKEVPFRMHGDETFHVYNIFPDWAGRVTRLRFDPPGGKVQGALVEIASIEIMALPAAPRVAGPVWEFAGTLAGFTPSSYVEDFRFEPEAVVLTGFGPAATLTSQVLKLDADNYTWLTLDAEASAPTVVTVTWQDAEGVYSRDRARLSIPVGKTHHIVPLGRFGSWQGTVTGLRIQWTAAEAPVEMCLRRLALGEVPTGPPQLEILSLGTDRATTVRGNPVVVQAEVRNAGGTPLPAQTLAISTKGRPLGQLRAPQLGPGESVQLAAKVSLADIGEHALAVALPGNARSCTVHAMVVPALPSAPTDPRRAFMDPRQAVLNAGQVRVRAPAHASGNVYGPVFVEVNRDGKWRQVAVLPACGGLQTGADAHRELAWGTVQITGTKLTFTAVHRDRAGKRWQSTGVYALTGEPDRIAMTHTLRSGPGGKLLRYDGPLVRVGDGTFGARKYEALFPGLEYLSADEVSSSDRDILPPGDLRAIPHPNRVCIPTMAVTSPDRDLVALLWDNRQHWFGAYDQPSAVFASPNLVESQDPRLSPSAPPLTRTRSNHLLGLFAPSIPAFLRENDVRARTPVALPAGAAITLRSVLLVRPNGEVLDAVTECLGLLKPPPIGEPPMSLRDHYALAVRGFEEILYTEGEGWAGVKGWDPSPNPGTALMHLFLAEQLGRPELRRRAMARIGMHPALPLSLHTGSVVGAVQATRNAGMGALGRREPDGNWVFRPTEKTASLGTAGDTNVGMAAAAVRNVMRSAALSADDRLLQEGLKGLAWLRKWRVPRGAQVWEIPLHAPDILASAHCAAAFLWGYRLTGDESYLRDAVYWARTGLPFVYFWQTPEKGLEPMRGGTIPIFGATFYVGSWYGRLVQWCGLEHAKVLMDLAPYDTSHDWRTIARDITVSGWRQQQTKEGFQGLYPDSWCMLKGDISWGLMLSSYRLVANQLALDGFTPDGSTRLFRRGTSQVALLGPGEFLDASVGTKGDGTRFTELPAGRFQLDFTHRFRVNPGCSIAIVGVAAPKRVEMAGALVPRVDDLAGVAVGWTWSPRMPGVVIKLQSPERKAIHVTVHGLDLPAPPVARTQWSFDKDPEGWSPDHDLAPLTVRDGALVCTPTGPDPYLCVPTVDLPAAQYPRVRIRCRTPKDSPMQVFWGTVEGGFAPSRALGTNVQGGNVWQTVEIDLSASPTWRSSVVMFRIDPPAGGLEIDDIRFCRPGKQP